MILMQGGIDQFEPTEEMILKAMKTKNVDWKKRTGKKRSSTGSFKGIEINDEMRARAEAENQKYKKKLCA